MPKLYTFPLLFEDVLQLNISKIKKWGYLQSDKTKRGTITWSTRGEVTSSITIESDTTGSTPFITLDYKFNDEPRTYKVYLDTKPSNLGKGEVWCFLCPKTNKRCRNLYLIGGYFCHREAFTGVMYESQTQSKSGRAMLKYIKPCFETDKLYEQLYSKHFKKTYKGKPTKRYLKIIKKIEKARSIPLDHINRAFSGLPIF